MATTSRNLMNRAVLPAGAQNFLKRRALESGGLTLMAAGFFILLSLVSYNPTDPSFNAANGGAVANWMGAPGAGVADFFLQSIGLSSVILALIPAIWGWRIFRHTGIGRSWLRLTCLPVSLLLLATAFSAISAGDSWPLGTGYGGAAGDLALGELSALLAAHVTAAKTLTGAVAAILGAAALAGAAGFSPAEWGRALAATMRYAAVTSRFVLMVCQGAATAAQWAAARARRREPAERKEPSLVVDDGLGPVLVAPEEETGEPPVPETQTAKRGIVAPRKRKSAAGKRAKAARQQKLDLGPSGDFDLPPLDLLGTYASDSADLADEEALSQNARLLESVLSDFGVQGEVTKVRPGPVVTLYEFEPAPGVKSSRVIGLADDIARSMAAISVRVAVIPGKNVMGIELPNTDREIVALREILSSKDYEKPGMQLTLALGKDIGGTAVIADLARMPHLLIAGTTGSGKSVAINTMILSLLYRLPPEKCRLVMIDPKMLELSVYDDIPHLLCPVVTDPKKAVVALRWTVREMEQRYRAMSTMGVRNIASYNARLEEAQKSGEALTRTVQTGFDSETGEPLYEDQPLDMTPLPYIVVVVDEMADLMLVAGKEVEASVQRIAQMARAAGIHLIMATQRPSVDVITGTIKANFPTRISFQVTSKIDSRTILGEAGAEQLLGQGDMLYMAGGGRLTRVHGPLVTDEEVESIVNHIKGQAAPDYVEEVTSEETESDFAAMAGIGGPVGAEGGGEGSPDDALYDQAVAIVCRDRKASTSYIQRRLQIGYNRAARLIDRMEEQGVISGANHVGKREVLARDIDDRTQ